MCVAFFVGALLRWSILYTVTRGYRFAHDFEGRVHEWLKRGVVPGASFRQVSHQILQTVFDIHFTFGAKGKLPFWKRWVHKIFSIEAGVTQLLRDTDHYSVYLEKLASPPETTGLPRLVLFSNPVFNRVFPISPMGVINQLLNALPGLFLTSGVLGTVLRLASRQAISTLELTHFVIPTIIGLVFSIGTTILNALMNCEGIFINLVNKYAGAMEMLWQHTRPNEIGFSMQAISEDESLVPARMESPPPEAPKKPVAPKEPESRKKDPRKSPVEKPTKKIAPQVVLGLDFGEMSREPTLGPEPQADFLAGDDVGKGEPTNEIWREVPLEKPPVKQSEKPPESAPGTAPGEANDPPEIQALRERAEWLQQRIHKADTDREVGLISEQMWKDKIKQWEQEKEQIFLKIKAYAQKKGGTDAA
jgi:hypothetical protein